jgi:hypothetical protein
MYESSFIYGNSDNAKWPKTAWPRDGFLLFCEKHGFPYREGHKCPKCEDRGIKTNYRSIDEPWTAPDDRRGMGSTEEEV